MQVSLFNGFTDKNPKPITIREVVEIIRADQRLQVLTENHRCYRDMGDTTRADAEKQHMPCFSVAVLFNGGKQQKHIVSYTGLSIVDLDHIPGERMAEVLEKVQSDEHTLLAYTTISGEGVRVIARFAFSKEDSESRECLLRADKKSLVLYTKVFALVNSYYENLTGLLSDGQCKNATRISGMAHDPKVYYNPEATPFIIKPEDKKTIGRPRKGTKVERVETTVLRELELRGVVYGTGTHNKYISDACYMMNRYGVSESDCTAWALERFADYDEAGNDVASIVRSCYMQTEEHATARLPRQRLSNQASVADIQRFLTESGVKVRYNVITRKREISFNGNTDDNDNCLPDGNNSQFSTFNFQFIELTDDHINSLYCRFCLSTGLTTRPKEFNTIIESDFYPTYNPLHEYLESLPAWDGTTDYIDQLASMVHVTGCTQEMHNRFFKKWMVAMVAAWMDEGITNHEILTYIGPQGRYKTTFMTRLLPPVLGEYFATKTFKGRMDKDDRLALTELALIDLEELDNMRPEAVNLLKAITTDPAINLRPVWERYVLRRQHIASFCGTGNNPRFLTDLSGNRRWLPFMVESIDSPWERATDYDGIYAQAYALWQQGFRYWFDDAENAELEQHNRQFEEPNIEEELILTYLRKPYGDEAGEFLTATRIIELIGMYVKCPLSPKRVAFAMNRLGYRQRRVGGVRGYNVIILTGNDIKEQQRFKARNSDPI